MPRPIHAVVHQDALTHNLQVARNATPNSQVFAVVKANAYGHGIERVYPALSAADGFALLDLAEAKRIRALGWTGPILLLEGVFSPQDLYDCTQDQLSFTVHHLSQIEWIERHPAPAQFHVYLKMNSGMNRLGFQPAAYREAWQRLHALPQVASITHMTHFSDADGSRFGESGINYQQRIFEQTVEGLAGPRSVSNSAAILRHPLHSDVVRSGIMLYGSAPDYPAHSIDHWILKPTMSLRSELLAIQDLQPNDTVGYGSSFMADRPLKIGIVACGYADGYQRISPTGTPILVDGVRTRTVGRVSMDMLAVDLTPVPQAAVGSEVVLWGRSKTGATLSIDEVAVASGTVGYELMCAVTARVPFIIQT